MHIEAELDEVHAERLARLQTKLRKPLSEVIAVAIDAAVALQETSTPPDTGSRLFKLFDAAGLIGCIETGDEFATTYKQKLDFSGKHGRPA